MKFDPGKAWPHPVLRPPDCGDDYPHAEFQVDIEVLRTEGGINIQVIAEFELSDPNLLRLVKEEAARYMLVLRAPKTHLRRLLDSTAPQVNETFPGGEVSGRIELSPFLVCTRALDNFQSDGWHEDFAGRTFNIAAGAVLAEDKPKEYWVDTADEAPIGSIFEHGPIDDLPDGRWVCHLDGDRVKIMMSTADSQRYAAARNRVNGHPDGQYLINGIYLPALIKVLHEADQDQESYEDCRWFASLNQRLEAVGCKQLGDKGADRLVDAQVIFDSPFAKLPVIVAEAEEV